VVPTYKNTHSEAEPFSRFTWVSQRSCKDVQHHTHTHTWRFNGHHSKWTWVSQFSLDSHHTSCLTLSHHVLLRQKGRQWRKRSGWKVHSSRGNWCRVYVAGCLSCHQPVIKTFTGPRLFFNHQRTPEQMNITLFYVCSQTSAPIGLPDVSGETFGDCCQYF